jgi:hypothetical protein
MSLNRRAAKRDANERAIIDALVAMGAVVQQLSAKGVPDLLVSWKGYNLLMEVKMPKAKLTEDEKEWHSKWNGQVDVVYSIDDALIVLEDYTFRALHAYGVTE